MAYVLFVFDWHKFGNFLKYAFADDGVSAKNVTLHKIDIWCFIANAQHLQSMEYDQNQLNSDYRMWAPIG